MRRCYHWMRFRPGHIRTTLVTAAVLTLGASAGASAMGGIGSGSITTQRGSVLLSGSPSTPAVNLKTHTLYVPIQCTSKVNCPGKPTARLLDIIDTSRCNARTVSGCSVVGEVDAGNGPLDAVIDPTTDTVYVIDAAGAVSVLDGGRCNAVTRTHCKVEATINTGGFAVAGALDSRTHTLYVAAPSGDVFVIDVANCNAHTTSGCGQPVRKVKDPRGPSALDIDLATDTIYVADSGTNGPGSSVTVINGARCNGSTGVGCSTPPRTIAVGSAPFWVTVDQFTNTVYVANNNDNTVSVINGATCNGTVSSGCARHPAVAGVGGSPSAMAVDPSLHTLFVLNQTDGTMSEIDTSTCTGQKTAGCPTRARNAWLPWKPPIGYNPNFFSLVPGTGTAYLVNVGGEAFLAADSVKGCSAVSTSGCRVEASGVAVNGFFPEVDPTTDTIYAGDANNNQILVIDGAKCNASKRSGCAPVATIPFPHPQANLGSIDQTTHTLYAGDTFANKVYAIDIKHCNAHDTSGCQATASSITVGMFPSLPVLDTVTHTLYVPDATGTSQSPSFNDISVIDASTCNAQVTSGCTQTPGKITVGPNTFTIGLSAQTNTIYAPVLGQNFLNNTVWVINGASCQGSNESGCGSAVVAKAKVGLGPSSVVVDDTTQSVYVDNNANGDHPGTVSIINGTTCSGSNTSSCASAKSTITVGRSPTGMALDAAAHRVFVADFSHAAISVIDTSSCNSGTTSGCPTPAPEVAVGSQPGFVWVNSKDGTVYATTHLSGGGTFWSIVPEP